MFVHAAEQGQQFRIGLVGGPGFYRSAMCPSWVRMMQQAKGGGGLYRDYFATENFVGGKFSPPLGIPKLQLPHSHPNTYVNTVHRAMNS